MLGLYRNLTKESAIFALLSGKFNIFNYFVFNRRCQLSTAGQNIRTDQKPCPAVFPGEGIFDTSILIPSTEVIHKWHKKFSLWRLCCVTPTSL